MEGSTRTRESLRNAAVYHGVKASGLGCFRVWGLEFGVWGLGFGVWGFRVWGVGFGV